MAALLTHFQLILRHLQKNDRIITTESIKNTSDRDVASKLFEISDRNLETLNNKGFSKITRFLIKGILGEILIP